MNSSSGDNGILTGNWSGNYAGGTSPTAWSGSVGILKEFMETKKAVNFGQCWVFSGVLTSGGYFNAVGTSLENGRWGGGKTIVRAKYLWVSKTHQSPLESVIVIFQKNTTLYSSIYVISNIH